MIIFKFNTYEKSKVSELWMSSCPLFSYNKLAEESTTNHVSKVIWKCQQRCQRPRSISTLVNYERRFISVCSSTYEIQKCL